MVDIERAHRIPVKEELHPGRVGADAHVHRLPGIEVPVGEYVHERRLVVVRPFRAEHIRAVLGEPGGVVLPEVAVLGGIRRWLTDVVESRPDELPGAEFRVPVPDYALLGILRAPAGAAVAQGGALLVIVRQHRLRQGEVVYTTALHDGSGFAAIDEPVRVLLVVLVVEPLAVVIPHQLEDIAALLPVLPLHEVGAEGGVAVVQRIVGFHQAAEHGGDLLTALVRMGVEDLVAHAPADYGGAVPVAAHPGSHIALHPLVEEARVVILRLAALPHVESLGKHQHAGFVSKLHESLRRHVVGGADSVHAHLP